MGPTSIFFNVYLFISFSKIGPLDRSKNLIRIQIASINNNY